MGSASITQAELDLFYEGMVRRVRGRGGVAAITSGMACVEFGVAQSTRDCDLLCAEASARILFDILESTQLDHAPCRYRGVLTAPLDKRWLDGGWTSHFFWKTRNAEAYLDVFGIAPRETVPWTKEIRGLYVSPHTVAEMKRTDREKDWPFATALGAQLLEAGDPRGWLHVFDAELLRRMILRIPCPKAILAKRPVLSLALRGDKRLEQAVHVEKLYWSALDRVRIRLYQRAARPYAAAVRKARVPASAPLPVQHDVRIDCARSALPRNPIGDFGFDALIEEARQSVMALVPGASLESLPDVSENFRSLLR